MIENWEDAAFETDGRVTTFRTEHLEITFTGTGIEGGCPAEESVVYPRWPLTTENAAAIPCTQVLGAYRVTFPR